MSPRFTLSVAIALSVLSYVCLWALGYRMAGLVAGIIGLDIEMQSGHISNQARIYALDAESRNRINAVYMVASFAGGALGSIPGAFSWELFGRHGVCATGLGFLTVAAAVHGPGGSGRFFFKKLQEREEQHVRQRGLTPGGQSGTQSAAELSKLSLKLENLIKEFRLEARELS